MIHVYESVIIDTHNEINTELVGKGEPSVFGREQNSNQCMHIKGKRKMRYRCQMVAVVILREPLQMTNQRRSWGKGARQPGLQLSCRLSLFCGVITKHRVISKGQKLIWLMVLEAGSWKLPVDNWWELLSHKAEGISLGEWVFITAVRHHDQNNTGRKGCICSCFHITVHH